MHADEDEDGQDDRHEQLLAVAEQGPDLEAGLGEDAVTRRGGRGAHAGPLRVRPK